MQIARRQEARSRKKRLLMNDLAETQNLAEEQNFIGREPHAEMRAINEQLIIAAVRQQELAEAALKTAERALQGGTLYRLLAKNFPNGMVLLFDPDLRHILAGGRGLAALGLSEEALEGKTLWEKFAPEACRQLEPAYRAALAGEATVLELFFPVHTPSGDSGERLYQIHALPVLGEQGDIFAGMAVAQDVTEQRRAEQALRHQAHHDALTGLPNRALLRDRLSQIVAATRRSGGRAALLFVDLNHFKSVNDTLGHAAGDRLLQTIAARLTGCLRAQDTVGRMSGDEFVVLLPGLHAAGDAAEVVRKVEALIAAPVLLDGQEVHMTASVGVSLFPDDGADADALLKNADAAMYQAKKAYHALSA